MDWQQILIGVIVGSVMLALAATLHSAAKALRDAAEDGTAQPADRATALNVYSGVSLMLIIVCTVALLMLSVAAIFNLISLNELYPVAASALLVLDWVVFGWIGVRVVCLALDTSRFGKPWLGIVPTHAALLAVNSAAMAALAIQLANRGMVLDASSTFQVVTFATMVLLGGLPGTLLAEAVSQLRSVTPNNAERSAPLIKWMDRCAGLWAVLGALCCNWLGVNLGFMWIVYALSTLPAQARARQLTSLWTLAIAARSGNSLPQELERRTHRPCRPGEKPLRRLADQLSDGEAIELALAHSGIVPRASSMEVQAGVEVDRLAAVLQAAAARETARFTNAALPARPYALTHFGATAMVMICIVGFLMYYIIPKIKKIFEDFGTELPALTKLLIGLSDAMVNYWYLVFPPILLATAAGVAMDFLGQRLGWRSLMERLLGAWLPRLRMPDVLRALSWGVRADRPLHEVLAAMTLAPASQASDARLKRAAEQVREGEDVWYALHAAGWLKAVEVDALQRAQAVGNLPWVMESLSEAEEARWEYRFARRSQWLQPVFTAVFGVMVFFVVVAIFMPLIKLLNDLS